MASVGISSSSLSSSELKTSRTLLSTFLGISGVKSCVGTFNLIGLIIAGRREPSLDFSITLTGT
ncbi:unnamed protein product [Schistosoma mattheei]|uniref:Uncharacterized protein n=1 Tax=Schistosoma mattheei TaxID=31246 RepID=A0A3P8CV53_9TREM|nr:unnamed protein product [Schistosoma mattheei]